MSDPIPQSPLSLNKAHVVGTFHCELEKGDQATCIPQEIDAIELRLDLLGRLPLLNLHQRDRKPIIMTARHAQEGGNPHVTPTQRLALLREAIPQASFIDLELRFWEEASSILELAQKAHVGVIASFHDFTATPTLSELLEKSHTAKECGADIFKVATYLKGPTDLACLLQFLATSPLPLAVMGMGPLGMASRLVLARCGSVLNYGWLVRPFVSGQWPADKFVQRLKELMD